MALRCRACNGSNLIQFLDLGKMPLANGFLTEEEFENEKFYPLKVGYCADCEMVQLINPIPPEILFNEKYPFVTGSSKHMEVHFDELADEAIHLSNKRAPRLVEIGSNDGTLLARAKDRGARVFGFEPSRTADIANERGIRTLRTNFDMLAARNYIRHGPFIDIIVATNTLCHVHDLNNVLLGIKMILAHDGIFVFEDPYWPDIIELCAYDQIYDEHKWYFSVSSVMKLLDRHGLRLIAAHAQPTHGGSMRYWVRHKNWNEEPSILLPTRQIYESQYDLERLLDFQQEIEAEVKNLKATLQYISEGHRIAGYGATSKSTVILNLLGGEEQSIDYITDTTLFKQGKFSPGAHIPIVPPSQLRQDDINHIILFAWNHAQEIFENEQLVRERNIQWIFHSRKIKDEKLLQQ